MVGGLTSAVRGRGRGALRGEHAGAR
jgi:hypothetical protein